MKKSSIEIGKINNTMNLKVCLMIEDKDDPLNKFGKTVSRFQYDGNDYVRVNANPYLTIDIASRKERRKEGWNANQTANFNRSALYGLIVKVRELLQIFRTEKDLFYYENGALKVNANLMNQKGLRLQCKTSRKTILLEPAVIPDEDNQEIVYEGCLFCINSYDNFCYLTYSELEYLYYELNQIDLTRYAVDLLKLEEMHRDDTAQVIPTKTESQPKEETLESPSYVKIKKADTIPDI